MPSIVGVWLAGTYDRDRPVSKAAADGISSFLDTDEKVTFFWRKCQTQILEFAREAIQETAATLSDERNTNADDLQEKFDRVIGASLSLIINLLQKLSPEDIAKHQESYESLLVGNSTLWGFVASKSSFLRKKTSELLMIFLEKQPDMVEEDLKSVGNAFINEGLGSRAIGSELAYMKALDKLTARFPTVWTMSYKSKTTPLARLKNFLIKGSLSSPAEWWIILSGLITRLSSGFLPETYEGATEFLKAVNAGIASRDEAKTSIGTAWICYVNVVKHFLAKLSDSGEKTKLLVETVYPIFEAYVRPTTEATRWMTGNSTAALAKAFHLCVSIERLIANPEISIKSEWKRLAETVMVNMQTSQPEQSKEYHKSQMDVIAESHRWFGLQAEIIKYDGADKTPEEHYVDILAESNSSIVECAINVLATRNGKPYGAAGVLENAIKLMPSLIENDPEMKDNILKFSRTELPRLLLTPSCAYLVAASKAFATLPGQLAICLLGWDTTIGEIADAPDSVERAKAFEIVMASRFAAQTGRVNEKLQRVIVEAMQRNMKDGARQWRRLCETALLFHMYTDETINQCIDEIVAASADPERCENALASIEFLVGHRPEVLELDDVNRIKIMARLIAIEENGELGLAMRATVIRKTIGDIQSFTPASYTKKSPIVTIIQDNLETAGPLSLSIPTLVSQAQSLVSSLGLVNVEDLFPNHTEWARRFQVIGTPTFDNSIALTNSLNGAVVLVEPIDQTALPGSIIRRDLDGFSVPFRMALYTSELFSYRKIAEKMSLDTQVRLRGILAYTVFSASDQVDLAYEGWFWASLADPVIENQIREFIVDAKERLHNLEHDAKDWRNPDSVGQSLVCNRLFQYYLQRSHGLSALAFYSSRIMKQLLTNLTEFHGWQKAGGDAWLESLGVLKPDTPDIFMALAVLKGLQYHLADSKLVRNLLNRLVSEVPGMGIRNPRTLPTLLMLNDCLDCYEKDEIPVAKQRLVFLVKHITSWMDSPKDIVPEVAAQKCRALRMLLPEMSTFYGGHWQTTIEFVVSLWDSKCFLENPHEWLHVIQQSLKLIVALKRMAEIKDEGNIVNEDLKEAIDKYDQRISDGFVRLLHLKRPEKETQPWTIVNNYLRRIVARIPENYLHDLDEIYPLIAAQSSDIQTAAFIILHRALPAAQAELSVNVLLEKKDAQLPDELLSLLLDAPKSQDYSDEALARFPAAVRTYLLALRLVYDAFSTASHKVRSDYTTNIKTENLLNPLLDFIFDILGHSHNSPIDLHREGLRSEQIRNFDIELSEAEPEEKSMHWLMVHIYYSALQYTPGLVKNWFVDCKSKQTRLAVQAWTEKYFSPLVIEDTLTDVQTWADEQEEPADDEKELIVKVSRKSREVYAGYEVDEMMMQIVVRFPSAYPLEGIKVEGVNRVAVGEKKWQSWLMITQGVITFSVCYPGPPVFIIPLYVHH